MTLVANDFAAILSRAGSGQGRDHLSGEVFHLFGLFAARGSFQRSPLLDRSPSVEGCRSLQSLIVYCVLRVKTGPSLLME